LAFENSVDQETIKDLEIVKFLGQGSFGKVSLWKSKLYGNLYAIKQMSYRKLPKSIEDLSNYINLPKEVKNKLSMQNLTLYDHSRLDEIEKEIKENLFISTELINSPSSNFFGLIHFYFYDDSSIYLAFNYFKYELNKYWYNFDSNKNRKSRVQERFSIIAQFSYALSNLQRIGAAQNDLKPENIMVSEDGCLKIIDLGWASHNLTKTKGHRGLTGYGIYEAWEYLNKMETGWSSDNWKLGILSHEMIFGKLIFNIHKTGGKEYIKYMINNSPLDSLFRDDIINDKDVNEFIYKNGIKIDKLTGLLNRDPETRTEAIEVYLSFNGLFDEKIKACSKN